MPVIDMKTGRPFPTGAVKTPRHKLQASEPFRPPAGQPPPQAAYVPAKLDLWGNGQYGDCVTAEEAFAKAATGPEIFIDANTVVAWARAHGFLNGANLTDVMDAMQSTGFLVGSRRYNDGPYAGVDYSNESILQAAIAQGPVKIAIDHSALPPTAGNQQGWYATGGSVRQFQRTDHCVGLCGYGTAAGLFAALGVPPPAELAGQSGYLLFTWATIGFVDHAWVMSTVAEAWVRNPTTIGVPPLPAPTPPTPVPPGPGPAPVPPGPGPAPTPVSAPVYSVSVSGSFPTLFGGHQTVTMTGTATPANTFHTAGAVNVWAVLGDLGAIYADYRSGNLAALTADVAKLAADLGISLSPAGSAAGFGAGCQAVGLNPSALIAAVVKLLTDVAAAYPTLADDVQAVIAAIQS